MCQHNHFDLLSTRWPVNKEAQRTLYMGWRIMQLKMKMHESSFGSLGRMDSCNFIRELRPPTTAFDYGSRYENQENWSLTQEKIIFLDIFAFKQF